MVKKSFLCWFISATAVPQSMIWALQKHWLDSSGVSALTQQDWSWALCVCMRTWICVHAHTDIHMYIYTSLKSEAMFWKNQRLCPRAIIQGSLSWSVYAGGRRGSQENIHIVQSSSKGPLAIRFGDNSNYIFLDPNSASRNNWWLLYVAWV